MDHKASSPVDNPLHVIDIDLTWAGFERALGKADLSQQDFAACVRQACESTDIAFLFDLPVAGTQTAQRVAAVAMRDRLEAASADIRFIVLSADGTEMSLEPDCPHLNHAEAVARAYAALIFQ